MKFEKVNFIFHEKFHKKAPLRLFNKAGLIDAPLFRRGDKNGVDGFMRCAT